jgi:hypothetical protein
MKRVRLYRLQFVNQASSVVAADILNAGAGENGSLGESETLTSWHKVWDVACRHLSSDAQPLETVVIDPETNHVIATFTLTNQQIALAPDADALDAGAVDDDEQDYDQQAVPSQFPRWESEMICSRGGRTLFINRNASHFHWQLLDGARHEVPFRLSFLELFLDRHSIGPLNYCLDLAYEVCGRILPKVQH